MQPAGLQTTDQILLSIVKISSTPSKRGAVGSVIPVCI